MCEKCQDRGFTEKEHGLVMVFCDCEKGKEKRVEIIGEIPVEVTAPYAPDKLRQDLEAERYIRSRLQDEVKANDSNSGIGQPDMATRSGDTSQPRKSEKSKASKKAGKGTR